MTRGKPQPHLPPTFTAYLSTLTSRLEDHLEDRQVSAWLTGSGTLGDFDPRISDLDVQAVSTRRLARPELRRLAFALSHEALPCPARGLEFVLYAREDLTAPDGPAFQLNLNSGPKMEHHVSFHAGAEPRFWFVLDVAIARAHGHPLTGAPPEAILPALPRELVLSALRDSIDWYERHDHAETMIAASRAWAWSTEGRRLTKRDAATWAADPLPDPAPVSKALARGADPRAQEPEATEVAALLDHVGGVLVAAPPTPEDR
jgi:hypothetical protein